MYRNVNESLLMTMDAMQHVIEQGDEATVVDVARCEMPRVLAAVRALLEEHQPDENGKCPTCRDRRWWRLHHWRRPNVPCRSLLAARFAFSGIAQSRDRPSRHSKISSVAA